VNWIEFDLSDLEEADSEITACGLEDSLNDIRQQKLEIINSDDFKEFLFNETFSQSI